MYYRRGIRRKGLHCYLATELWTQWNITNRLNRQICGCNSGPGDQINPYIWDKASSFPLSEENIK